MDFITKSLLAVSFLAFSGTGRAQSTDSLIDASPDTVANTGFYSESQEQPAAAFKDTLAFKVRPVDAEILEDLKNDPDFNYQQPPSVGETIWQRFIAWLWELAVNLFGNAVGTNWGRVLVWSIAIAVLVLVIMTFLKVDAFRILFFGAKKSPETGLLHENIHEMDFDALLKEALEMKDYRKGVRLTFLHSLKILSDKAYIQWQPGKTNHEYERELHSGEVKNGYHNLSFYFDYTWYGGFTVTELLFLKVHGFFSAWREKVK